MEIFKTLSVPQLLEIKRIIKNGPIATAEDKADEAAEKAYLCHKSPPAGYPKEKSEYGDPSCYRYPLNTKARCLAAWRYVHHADNAKILGGKLSSVKSKIKSYAKKHYNLDLQEGESATEDWAKYFMEYYDAETMGERCEIITLEPEDVVQEDKLNEDKKTEATIQTDPKVQELEAQLKVVQADLASTQLKLEEANKELTTLREFKQKVDAETARAELLKNRKAIVEKSGLKLDLEAEAKWLEMSDDVFEFTVKQLSDIRNVTSATVKVPDVHATAEKSARDIVREGLSERKQTKKI